MKRMEHLKKSLFISLLRKGELYLTTVRWRALNLVVSPLARTFCLKSKSISAFEPQGES